MENESISPKTERILETYTELLNGHTIKTRDIVQKYKVALRTAQRDLRDIKLYIKNLDETENTTRNMLYNKQKKGYYLEQHTNILTNSEILAICKILLDSRAFSKEQMKKILHTIIECSSEEKELIQQLILNEEFHYKGTYHKYEYIQKMWEIGKAIQQNKYIEVEYQKLTNNNDIVKRKLKPIAILFSEYYFYVLALIEDKNIHQSIENFDELSPTVYRIDRIAKLKVLNQKFYLSYGTRENDTRINEGEFRKRVLFMRGGALRKVKFVYSGYDINGVLDKLPTAEILSEENNTYYIKAEVFGDGIDMWFRIHEKDVKEII